MTETTGHLFTPYIGPGSTVRARMTLSDADYAKIKRGKPWRATVTDMESGEKFAVKGADCGSYGCFCAAVIVKKL